MKRLALALLITGVIFVTVFHNTVIAEQTNTAGSIKSEMDFPLPPHFDGMTNRNFAPGLTTVAVYQFRTNADSKKREVAFTCVGNLFQTDTNAYSLLLPEHMFLEDGVREYIYAFRVARPDSRRIDGYVGPIVMRSKDFSGCDIALAEVSSGPTPVRGFSKVSGTDDLVIVFTDKVTVLGKRVTTLRSHITGKPVTVIGYALKPTEKLKEFAAGKKYTGKTLPTDEERPLIAIEESYMGGKSGSAFVDEHDRIFFVHRALQNDSGERQKEETIFQERFGRVPKGITLVTGPIMIEPEKK